MSAHQLRQREQEGGQLRVGIAAESAWDSIAPDHPRGDGRTDRGGPIEQVRDLVLDPVVDRGRP